MKREFKNPENPVVERFSGGGNLLSCNSKAFGGSQHSQANRICHAEFISASSHSQAEMSNSEKLSLPAGEGINLNSTTIE